MIASGFSLASTIDHLAPRLPSALVEPESLGAVRRLAESLPASLTSWIDFECRLHGARSQIDLSVRVDRRARDRFARYCHARARGSNSAAWCRAARFAEWWTTDRGDVEAVWLEFDLDAPEAAAARPRLFIDFAREPRASTAADGPQAALPISDRVDVIMNVLMPIVGGPPPDWLRYGAAICLRQLPRAAELLYVGLSADARITSVRFCVLGIDEHDAPGYLDAIGWPDDVASLRRAIAATLPADHDKTRAAILHVDITDRSRIGSRIGLEFPFRRRPQVKGVVADSELLADLVARGACAADKRDALLAWPGCEMSMLPHAIWPSLVLRRISHVKIVFDGELAPDAKAYLCVAHAWRPDLAR